MCFILRFDNLQNSLTALFSLHHYKNTATSAFIIGAGNFEFAEARRKKNWFIG